MSEQLWRIVKTAPALLGASFLIAQGAMANPQTETGDQYASPDEALGVIRKGLQLRPDPFPNSQNSAPASSESISQVTSVSELRDVEPTEWAYEALRSLVERYGCIVGYPDRTFRGNRALSRWEFAAGLNACMNVIERLLQENVAVLREDIDKLNQLAKQFEQELAALTARVDNLETRVAFLEDHQFSTTTKLSGENIFAPIFQTTNSLGEKLDGSGDPEDHQATFGFRTRLNFETSFTGKDRLRTRLQIADMPNLGGATGTQSARLAFDDNTVDGTRVTAEINDLFYRFPIGSNFTAWVGASGLNLDDIFNTLNPFMESSGSGALSRLQRYNSLVYRARDGAGLGLRYKFGDIADLTALYLADDSGAGNPEPGQGLFNGNYATGAQLTGYFGDALEMAFTYLHTYSADTSLNFFGSSFSSGVGRATGFRGSNNPFSNAPTVTDRYGLQLNWRITPGLNFAAWGGYGDGSGTGVDQFGVDRRSDSTEFWTWNANLSLVDVMGEGNVLTVGGGLVPRASEDITSGYIIEAQYKLNVSKNILLTPGAYVLINPNNLPTGAIWVGTIRTTFKF